MRLSRWCSAPVWPETDTAVRRHCVERMGIAESDIRSVSVLYSRWQYVVLLWNRRQLVIDAERIVKT